MFKGPLSAYYHIRQKYEDVILMKEVPDQKSLVNHAIEEITKSVSKKYRPLSPHVGTRIYRPPEVALNFGLYDTSFDIWSLGCVLAELMILSGPEAKEALAVKSSSKKREMLSCIFNNRYMFPSDSCFPISPRSDLIC